jgi:uncharacterized membrane protein HdeD (DUF308 family)
MNEEANQKDLRSRDAQIFKLLGAFFLCFGVLVWFGLFWEQPSEGRIVNFVSGLILLLVGFASIRLGKRTSIEDNQDS